MGDLSPRTRGLIAELGQLVDWLNQGGPDRLRKRDRGSPVPDGYPTSTLGDGAATGDPARSPTLSAVTRREALRDRVNGHMHRADYVHACRLRMDAAERRLVDAARELLGAGREGLRTPMTEHDKAHSVAGFCQACGRAVAGTDRDRLKAGYDEACYKAWRRWLEDNPDGDRVAYERHRRITLQPATEDDPV